MKIAAILLSTMLVGQQAVAPADQPLRMKMVDAEGGAATLYVTPEGRSVLVDTGWPANAPDAAEPGRFPEPPIADLILEAANELGLSRIDYLIVTHYHLDHVGGVHDLLARIPVGMVVDHGPNREPPRDGDVTPHSAAGLFAGYEAAVANLPRRSVGPGDTLEVGSLVLTFVAGDGRVIEQPLPGAGGETSGCDAAPGDGRIGEGENPRSLGYVATYGQARILDLADATVDVEKQLVCPTNRIGPVDLMLVSHHGSQLSNSPALIAAAAPRVALMGNGPRKGGDESVLETLAAAESAPVVWQQHFAVRSPDANRPEDYIANLDEHPGAGGHALEVTVSRDGGVRVTNRRNRFSEFYPPVR